MTLPLRCRSPPPVDALRGIDLRQRRHSSFQSKEAQMNTDPKTTPIPVAVVPVGNLMPQPIPANAAPPPPGFHTWEQSSADAALTTDELLLLLLLGVFLLFLLPLVITAVIDP